MNEKLSQAIKKSANGLARALPFMLSIILLISLANVLIPKSVYMALFTGGILDPVVGSIIGSVFAGNPITSYILGGELLDLGVSLIAVTAFLVSWVTVGLVQLPAEAMLLGKKFAISRNILSFIFSILVAITTVALVSVI